MNDEQKKALNEEAGRMAKELVASLGLDQVADLSKKIEGLMAKESVQIDSKLMKIMGGKDYSKDADKLTKNEKIVGFMYALISKNEPAVKALSEGVSADGGYLLPQDFRAEIIRELTDMVVMRKIARVVPMKRNTMVIPTLTSSVEAYWTLENATKTTTTARFSQLTLTAFKLASILYASDELVEDSSEFDVVQLIVTLFAESIAVLEEYAFMQGNGTTQPQGIVTARTAGTIPTTSTSGSGFDKIIDLEYALPQQYTPNAVFISNRKLKDSNGRYLWQEPVALGQPATLHGYPKLVSTQLPDGQIYFGDFKKAYWIGDRGTMAVKITNDSETAFTKDQTAIRVVTRVGGMVVLGSALRALTGF